MALYEMMRPTRHLNYEYATSVTAHFNSPPPHGYQVRPKLARNEVCEIQIGGENLVESNPRISHSLSVSLCNTP
jgi:hypothetical protein